MRSLQAGERQWDLPDSGLRRARDVVGTAIVRDHSQVAVIVVIRIPVEVRVLECVGDAGDGMSGRIGVWNVQRNGRGPIRGEAPRRPAGTLRRAISCRA